ncbi:hypothetical protein KC19_5G020000 [Ceratodon purpureus]|uniref:C3H1-type domain-containing protein n=1 Tax=Ceratodon purpureus TaxID=3225 RepID=A0A8T0HYD5_CERPU|nr:hypothetical protein KC19_5G020000 [Ceratodon purpureus]
MIPALYLDTHVWETLLEHYVCKPVKAARGGSLALQAAATMSGAKQTAPRILVFGDVLGRLDAFVKRLQSVNEKNGPFDAALCVGQFFPADGSGVEGVEGYFKGEKAIPVPTYFIGDYGDGVNSLLAPARSKALDMGFSMDGIPVCDNLLYLKGSGVLLLKGLRIAYLSGKYIPDVYKNARGAEASGGHFEDDVDALRAIADEKDVTDIFISNEWPRGVTQSASAAEGIDVASTGSDISAELASILKPRYHFSGSEGVFYAREPYVNPDATHVTRFIGLGAVGNENKQKFVHALSPTPASVMSASDLASKPTNTTMSPYIKGAHRSSTAGTAQKRDVGQMDKASADDGQYWRYDTSQGKRQRRNDGGDRVCFEFVKQGSCSRGETCKFKHDLGDGKPIPKGACFDFITKGQCEKGAECRYKHSLEDNGAADEALPPGSCFDFFRKGECGRGSECRFSHSLDDPRPTRTPRPPPDACWFCLSSPNIETHLVASVGDHCYCALAKGPLCPGHVLILPIEHQPSIISLPSDAELELEKYKHAIRECFKKQGKATIFFERYLQLRAGTHAHLQAVPIPLSKASLALSSFISSAKEVGFTFEVIHPGEKDHEARERLKELVGRGVNYFMVELHEGTLLAHPLSQGEKLPMQFGREVLANILGTPERGDWKQCKLDVSEETAMADQFKEQFQEFDPMP